MTDQPEDDNPLSVVAPEMSSALLVWAFERSNVDLDENDMTDINWLADNLPFLTCERITHWLDRVREAQHPVAK